MTKKFGIRITLPKGDPLATEHLLGDNWEEYRWFESAEKRDQIYTQMGHRYRYLRQGDGQSQVLDKVER